MDTNSRLNWQAAGQNAIIGYLPLPTRAAYPALLQGLARALLKQFPAIHDAVPAYRSLLLRYTDGGDAAMFAAAAEQWLGNPCLDLPDGREVVIPVCYQGDDFAPDLPRLGERCGLTREAVITLHSARVYDVYCIGFLPGFAFLGYVDDAIATVRHAKAKEVPAGSVGIAGKQTGCYPLTSPGGWQIIGRTPMSLYAPEQGIYSRFMPGDRVRFQAIDRAQFDTWAAR